MYSSSPQYSIFAATSLQGDARPDLVADRTRQPMLSNARLIARIEQLAAGLYSPAAPPSLS
jgi:hypothetical protein